MRCRLGYSCLGTTKALHKLLPGSVWYAGQMEGQGGQTHNGMGLPWRGSQAHGYVLRL